MYNVAPPPAELSRWVECLWELRPGAARPWEELVSAELSSDVVIALGTAYRHDNLAGSSEVSSHTYLGLRQTPEVFVHYPTNHLLGVRLRPGAASQLFRWHGDELCGRQQLQGRTAASLLDAANYLVDRYHASAGGALLTREDVQRALVAPIRGALCHVPTASIVVPALKLMEREHCFRIALLARQLGVTERTLERRFRDELGVRPKVVTRMVRIHLAQCALRSGLPAATIARRLGFSDQPHLCSEMRSLCGTTPGERRTGPPVCRISPRPVPT